MNLALILLLAPLGVIGLWRWSIYLYKVWQASKYKPVPQNDAFTNDQVSLVVPVYNEEPEFFSMALTSWLSEKPGHVYLVIDHSDKACITVAKRFQKSSVIPITISVTKRPGKREALVDGMGLTQTEFVTLIDSDTIFEPGALQILLAPFVDERIGGTAPRQRVWDTKTVVQKVYQIQLEERYDVEMPFLDVGGLTTTCISGRTAMYRMAAVQDRLSELEVEYFWGQRCVSGDDKCLTRIIQRNDWLVKYQDEALVWTHAAPDLLTYLKQRIRWTRNTCRSDLTALTTEGGWIFRNRNLTLHSIDRFVQPFTLILGPIFLFTSLYWGLYLAATLFVIWILATRFLKVISHIARSPRAILVLPQYIVMTYLIAVLKIYALFTIRTQGWITRWSKNRLSNQLSRLRSFARQILPVGATIGVIVVFSQGFNLFYEQAIASVLSDETNAIRNIQYQEMTEAATALEEEIRHPTAVATHKVRSGDSLRSIAQLYNVLPSDIAAPNGIVVGVMVEIPIGELRNENSIADLIDRPTSSVSFVPFASTEGNRRLTALVDENVVSVFGAGTAISIAQLFSVLQSRHGNELVEEVNPGEWLLKASIQVERDATLYLEGDEVQWLKLYSSADYYAWLATFDGSLHIENTKITSWNPRTDSYDMETEISGRSFILAKNSGRMDIIDAELSYLGHIKYGDQPTGYPFGGSYGVSWKIEGGELYNKIITGNVIDSSIHHNQFGIYTYGSTGNLMRGNIVYRNDEYGFDPHDDSRYIIIEDNRAYENGNHGIITSKRCVFNLIANNHSVGNELHGVMLDQSSNQNLVIGNTLTDNTDGVVALDSHQNIIIENVIAENRKAGVRFNKMSHGNYVINNAITENDKGVYLYEGAMDNHFSRNRIADNRWGIHLRGVMYNAFTTNALLGNDHNTKVNERSLNNYVEHQ